MNTRHITAGAIALLMFAAPLAARTTNGQPGGQVGADQKNHNQTQFTTEDRQAATDWYGKNQANPPKGFRQEDRLSSDQESRFKVGSKLDSDLQKMAITVPKDLALSLTTPSAGYHYASVGGHITLLDKQNEVQDIIRRP